MARKLGIPIRTWYNYESGVTVPAEVLLKFMELTAVEPLWLLHGRGTKFRAMPPGSLDGTATVESLLRTALHQLERKQSGDGDGAVRPGNGHRAAHPDPGVFATEISDVQGVTGDAHARREWLAAEREDRCVRVVGDAMAPIVAEGAQVAFSADDEPAEALEGAMVVAWVEGKPIVRWFRCSGRYGLLRAENPEAVPSIQLVDLDGPAEQRRVRRVLWISTPHY